MQIFGPVGAAPVASIGAAGQYYLAAGHVILYGSNVLTNQLQLTAGHLTVHGATPVAVLAPPRVTWMGVEALHGGSAADRVSWNGVEVLRSVAIVPTLYVVSWMGVEALHTGAASDRVSWIGAEVLHVGAALAKLTWLGVEVLRSVVDRPPDTGFVYLIC